MKAMLVGADTLGNIPDVLQDYGITIHRHLSGRNSAHQRKSGQLPAGTDILILFTDFLGHNVMRHFRDLAASSNVRFIACRRSVCALKQTLTGHGFDHCGTCATPCRAGKTARKAC